MRSTGFSIGIAGFASICLFAAGIMPGFAATSDAAAAPAAPPACTTPPVSTPAGRFCGLALTVTDEGRSTAVDAYEGIRYGTAKRWTAPVPVPPPSTLVTAVAFGPICPQVPVKGVVVAQSEDCLLLNIWTPTRNSARNLPVMVFIHGGSFTSGAGQLPVYDGARLAAWSGTVVVTFNYRLGALGFLAGGSGADHLAGNYGFRDQQLALRWVRRNIRGFGGDPAKVTLFGESAGAMSVGAHLVSPVSRALFKNAIMESNPYGIPFKTPKEANAIRSYFDDFAGCKGKGLACLEKLPQAKIVTVQEAVTGAAALDVLRGQFSAVLAWAPYVDGEGGVIPRQPNRAAIATPVIAGTNRDEGTLFVYFAMHTPLDKPDYMDWVAKLFPKNAAEILAQGRYKPNDVDNRLQLSKIIGDYFFSCATRYVLAHATGPHFGYAFDQAPSFPAWLHDVKACNPPSRQVCHAVELPFVFRNPVNLKPPTERYRFTPDERKLVDWISAYWTDFALAGDPNSGAATPPEWPAFGAKGIRQVLNLKISQTNDAALVCPLWDRIGYNQGAASLY
jgi:carboxylesterase type B